jgi:TRAP transporter 4TM/12TM fusion protein
MGSISGSAIANVVTTGAFSIPLMKRLGYTPEQAGGVEAAASTGGQIMPPIMGAGAFLIAEFTERPYLEIVRLSITPAILYFATVYLFVDIIAAKRGMRGMRADELPRVRDVLREGWFYLLPLGILIWFLLRNISPTRVGFIAILALLLLAAVRWALRRFVLRVAEAQGPILRQAAGGANLIGVALSRGARNAVPVSVACAVSGVVVGVIGLTGLGLKFSSLMISVSGGNMLIALAFLLLASLVLGMGLPVTASYIVLAILAAPALHSEFGIPLVVAHLVIFWYSQDSNVTPPVALAAFAGAAIANANPMRTGVEAWKFAKGLYLIPLFMVYNPEIILSRNPFVVGWNILVALAALGAFAAALEGYMFTRMLWISRLLVTAGMVMVFWPSALIEAAGFATILLVLGINLTKRSRERRTAAPA